ncbi:organic cation transporter protein [Cylas formicarius]|uniref:organic cation transporter protein n=1 Tax=Cylas formicarius TaxID=197179 RepID=UPI00295892E1|nr:organic cation transporter protein [Cylas formicarius]
MGYDDVIPLLGDFGRYQKRIYFLLCLPAILCAFHKLGNVFLVAEPKYRCQLPSELPNSSYELDAREWDLWYPKIADERYSQCEIIIDNKTQNCDTFIYDHTLYGYTAVIEWQLTCDSAYLIATGNSIFMVGVMIGSIGFGEMSDRWGRKKTFFLSLVIQVVFGALAGFAPEFWSFSIARAVVGATTSGVFLVAYVIGLEMVGPSKRMIAGTVCHMFFSLGYMLTTVFALYITEWRSLQLALTAPGIVFLSYWWLIPESCRWLINQNRTDEAKRLIHEAAKVNQVTIAEETLESLLVPECARAKENADPKQTSVINIFRYPNLRKRSLIIFFDWFANNITYYGLSWNTNNLAGDPYLNFVISGAVEIPGYLFLILTLNRWGRKFVMCGCMILSGCALLLTIVVPADMQWLTISLAMIGKLSITASYGAVYIFSTEQFPTVIRNAGLGAGSTCARVGSITAPYINILTRIWQPLPLLIFGALSFVGGVMSLVLPETLNRKLPETFEEGEKFGRRVRDEQDIHLNGVQTRARTESDTTRRILMDKEGE